MEWGREGGGERGVEGEGRGRRGEGREGREEDGKREGGGDNYGKYVNLAMWVHN